MSQPNPTPTDEQPIWELVIQDMHSRDHVGRERYGTPLQLTNGRDSLQDAYEEALDLVVYLRQEMERRRILQAEVTRLQAQVAVLQAG
jgi:uncharacterized small protein (DUF1192 family)